MPRFDNSASSVALLGLRLRYKSGQLRLAIFGAIPTLQGHGTPYGLYNSLSTLHDDCSPGWVLTLKSTHYSQAPHNAQDSIRVAGYALPDRDFHPASYNKLRMSH